MRWQTSGSPFEALALAVALGSVLSMAAPARETFGSRLFPQAAGLVPSAGAENLSFAFPEVKLGDRLFFETRFAEFYFRHSAGKINGPLPVGDSVVDEILIAPGESLPGPFQGQSISCRQCHLGDDFIAQRPLAGRTYCDFSRRSAIPARSDGRARTVRNSPLMPDLGLPRDVPALFHFDGEFSSLEDLVIDTLTGRNFGWLPGEEALAQAHIAKVIREDDGMNARFVVDRLGRGIPYRVVLLGTDPDLPPWLRIPAQFRLDVASASDAQVLCAVAKLIHAYMDSLRFGTDNTFRASTSPYDLFLRKNALPTGPRVGESVAAYASRLFKQIEQVRSFGWVTPADDSFRLHAQRYQFGPNELLGLRIFFRSGARHAGNCVACHSPPQFTDHRFHNTGASQMEYDSLFGRGSFAALRIPGLTERNSKFEEFLPPSAKHPTAQGRFREGPSAAKPGYTDLGVWNVLGNPDLPKPQQALMQVLCVQPGLSVHRCNPASLAANDCRVLQDAVNQRSWSIFSFPPHWRVRRSGGRGSVLYGDLGYGPFRVPTECVPGVDGGILVGATWDHSWLS
jgi:hypothetical protein